MKKKTIIILTFFYLLSISISCSTLLGIKEPEEITNKTALEYLLKHNIDTSNVMFLKSNYLDTLKSLPFKPDWETGFRPIQFKIFNKYGDLIFQYSTCEGPIKNTLINKKFPPYNITPIDTTYTIKDEQFLTDDKITVAENTDYVVIIYWATYTGVIGRKFVKKIVTIIADQNYNIQIFKLNTDYTVKE